MHQNLVPTISHTQNVRHHAWKTVRTTLQYIVVFQSWGEVMKSRKTMEQICPTVFPVFFNLLLGIGEKLNIKLWF